MSESKLTIDGDNAVLEGEDDGEWLKSDAIVSLESWS